LLQAWKAEVQSRCEKLKSLQQIVERVSNKAGHGKADKLVDRLNNLSDQIKGLLAKIADRQVSDLLMMSLI